MAAGNTFDCFRECLGLRVVAVLKDAMPPHRPDIAEGTKTLMFDDGTGLTIASNGSFWREMRQDIERAISKRRDELLRVKKDIELLDEANGALALIKEPR